MSRRLPALILAAMVLSACGGTAEASGLQQVAARTGAVRSANLTLRLAAAVKAGEEVGFELRGPMSYGSPGGLPVARTDYTQFAGAERKTFSFTSTGNKAYVGVNGHHYQLPEQQLARIKDSNTGPSSAGLGNIHLDRWVRDAKTSDGPEFGGVKTDRFTGTVDVVQFFSDVTALAGGLGSDRPRVLPPMDAATAKQLRAAVRTSTIEVLAGRDDHVLRKAHVEIDLAGVEADRLKAAVGDFDHLSYKLDLGLAEIDRTVTVKDPPDVLPYEQLGKT